VLRRGFSTGTTAAAACKAAILSLRGPLQEVTVEIPCGLRVTVPVDAAGGQSSCSKYAGDYAGDVTAGLVFHAEAEERDQGTVVTAGDGIGRFDRETARYPKGSPAISQAAAGYIMNAVCEGRDGIGAKGVHVLLTVPGGVEVAKRTLNERIGVFGGISVLGTTGLVEPWGEHLCTAVCERIREADRVVVTTGRTGMRYARLHYPDHEVVLAGARIGEALDAAGGDVVLFGLPGLILRHIDPGILTGTGYRTVEEFSSAPEFNGKMMEVLTDFSARRPGVRVVIIGRDGRVLGGVP
jgi:cobalt-precorrin-5B (C1)-methyltransferase